MALFWKIVSAVLGVPEYGIHISLATWFLYFHILVYLVDSLNTFVKWKCTYSLHLYYVLFAKMDFFFLEGLGFSKAAWEQIQIRWTSFWWLVMLWVNASLLCALSSVCFTEDAHFLEIIGIGGLNLLFRRVMRILLVKPLSGVNHML